MAEVRTCQCDGCFRYQLHLPGGLHWITVTRVVEGPSISADVTMVKRVQFCDTCRRRADRFIFHRGLETQSERNARKAAAETAATLAKGAAMTKELRTDADTKPGT